MIIKATFHDNDFKNVLEGFFNKGLYLMLCYVKKGLTDSSEDLKTYKDISIKIDDYCEKIQDEKSFRPS